MRSSFPSDRLPNSNGFTLLELLVAIVIVGILLVLSFPFFGAMKERGKTVQCLSNLRTLGSSVSVYLLDHDNALPVFATSTSNWVWEISPYLPVPARPFSVSNDSVLLCPKAYELAAKPVSPGAATTYAINERVSGIRTNKIRHPAQTALFTDASTPWAVSVRIDRPPKLIHGVPQQAMVLYADFHVAGITAIPDWSTPFWKPDAE